MAEEVSQSGGSKRSSTMGWRRFRRVLLAIVMAGVVAAVGILAFRLLRHGRPYQAPPVAYEGGSTGLKQTVIVPTLDTPMPTGKNVIWCSSFQVAWNHLRDDVVKGPIQVANAQPIADRLNQAPQSEADLPDGSYYAAAGRVDRGIVGSIQKDMAAKFPSVPAPVFDDLAPDALVAYAYLTAGMKFVIPFFDSDGPLTFRGSSGEEADVNAFGIRYIDEYAYWQLRQQVEVLYAKREEYEESRKLHGGLPVPSEFALDPCKDSSPAQIVLATVPPKATLAETLAELDRKIHAWTAEAFEHERDFGVSDVLLVPNVFYKVRHRFGELEGQGKVLLNPGFRGWIQGALQSIEFKLDRSGAELASEATLVPKSIPRYFIFDQPFLIVMRKRGAEHPFFVMWVDNAELLCKWQGPADVPGFPPLSKARTGPR